MNNNATIIVALALCFCMTSCGNKSGYVDPLDYVDPFIATCGDPEFNWYGVPNFVPHSTSRCTVAGSVPFGMVSLGPVTRDWHDACSGYSAHDTSVKGFAFMHTNGSGWEAEFGNLLTMATTGRLQTCQGDKDFPGYTSEFKDSVGSPGYYASTLSRYGIRAECTATARCGALRFTFPKSDTSRIQSDLSYRISGSSDWQTVKVLNDSTVVGSMKYTPHTGGWGNGDAGVSYNLYFYGVLSKPMTSWGFWKADVPEDLVRNIDVVRSPEYMQMIADADVIHSGESLEGDCIGFFTEFPTYEGEQVVLKVAFSFVDEEGAKKNYEAEARNSGFDAIRSSARKQWGDELGKVHVKGGSDTHKRIYYTALYHTLADPRIFTDVDGRYTAGDGTIKVSEGYTRRTQFSGWDVFRSHMPLQTIINPSMVNDLINSQIDLAEESGRGYFNRWEMVNTYTGCMIGSPTSSVLADAWFKGIRGYDPEKALACAVKSSDVPDGGRSLYSPESCMVSLALETAYTDWCTGRVAESMGRIDIAKEMYKRSRKWRNFFNDDVKWFLPKDSEGNWCDTTAGWLSRINYGSLECNLLQQGWFVPHEFDTLAAKLGGKEKAAEKLDDFFSKTEFKIEWSPYYLQNNEPDHWTPFLFNRLGEPWKTQYWVRTILDKCFTDDVEGFPGNDDEGQMSAWCVLSMSGLHQVCPGDNRVEIMSPLFEEISFTLDPKYYKGKEFTIKTHGTESPDNVYIQKAALNGKPLNRCYLNFEEISNGGSLELWLGGEPNKTWGVENQ